MAMFCVRDVSKTVIGPSSCSQEQVSKGNTHTHTHVGLFEHMYLDGVLVRVGDTHRMLAPLLLLLLVYHHHHHDDDDHNNNNNNN